MRKVACAACQTDVPMAEGISVAERTFCLPCAERFVEEQRANKQATGKITRLVDPTVCVHCSADAGKEEWPTVAGLPACTACENRFRNRPYPTWLKISFVVFMCVAAAAFVYNLRFFLAYMDIVKGNHAMEARNVERAIFYFGSASDRLPEMPELAVLPNIYKAHQLSQDEKYAEALATLDKSRRYAPPYMKGMIREVELSVQMGQSFDAHNYDAFLEAAQELLKLRPDEPSVIGSIASAYACKYASSGDASDHDQAMQYLAQAKAKARGDAEAEAFNEYENRILHRLKTREILSPHEFKKRYPNGWKPEEGK